MTSIGDKYYILTLAQSEITVPFNKSAHAILSRSSGACSAPIIKISLYAGDCAIMQIIARIRFRLLVPTVVAPAAGGIIT